ncbi:MAG TPA: hypothetical protein VMT08_28630 [Bradyrhizobium sp.]|nr:hypothetical protein [Bradyrhizobium sp.]
MGWLDALERRARDAVRVVPAASVTVRQPGKLQPAHVIKTVWVQTAVPTCTEDPGAAEPAFYFVSNGVLNLCDEQGRSSGKSVALGSEDDPRGIAGRVKLEAWRKQQGGDFNRRIHYQALGLG